MNRENFKTILLFNLVMISVFLSYNLWTYQANFSLPEASTSLENVALANQRSVTDVVQPSHIVYHTGNSHYISEQAADVKLVTNILKSASIEDLVNLSEEMSIREIQNLITNDGQLEVVYPSSLSVNVLKKLYTIDDSNYSDIQINRIVINIDQNSEEPDAIYFVSLETEVILKATLANVSPESLVDVAENLSSGLTEAIQLPLDNNELIYLPKEPVTLEKIDLLAEYLDTETFQQALFSTTNYLNTETEGSITSYTDGMRLFTIDENTGILSFEDSSTVMGNVMSDSDLIGKSIEFINGHDGWTNEYRLYSVDGGNVLFRMMAEGLPIFGGGMISQMWGEEKIISYKRSVYQFDDSFQLSQEEVTLPSGEEVIAAIANSEAIKQENIQNIMIVYKMQIVEAATIEFADKYLQLVPIWCIKYNGIYYKLVIEEIDGVTGGDLIGLE